MIAVFFMFLYMRREVFIFCEVLKTAFQLLNTREDLLVSEGVCLSLAYAPGNRVNQSISFPSPMTTLVLSTLKPLHEVFNYRCHCCFLLVG